METERRCWSFGVLLRFRFTPRTPTCSSRNNPLPTITLPLCRALAQQERSAALPVWCISTWSLVTEMLWLLSWNKGTCQAVKTDDCYFMPNTLAKGGVCEIPQVKLSLHYSMKTLTTDDASLCGDLMDLADSPNLYGVLQKGGRGDTWHIGFLKYRLSICIGLKNIGSSGK